MELWQFIRILLRRKWLIIIGSIICVGMVAAINQLSGQKWEAYATIMEKLSSDDKVNIYNPVFAYQIDPRVRLANLAQLVRSRTVMERSAVTLNRERPDTDPDKVAAILQEIDVSPMLDTTILRISMKSDDEKLARDIADVVAREFIAYYNELNYGGAAKAKLFIESELPKAEQRLKNIRNELRTFKQANGVVMLNQQTDMLLQEMTQNRIARAQYEVQMNQAGARMQGLEQKLKDFPEIRMVSKTISANPNWQSLQAELGKQQMELQKMLRGRTEEHPEVKALRRAVNETERQLKETATTIFNSESQATNPIRDAVEEQYIVALVEYAAGHAAVASSKATASEIQPKLDQLPAKEMRLAQLTLDEESARNTYQLLRQKLDEAAIKEKEAVNSNTIQVVDPAKTRPADSRKGLKLILAIILAPIFCSGVALLLNYLDNTVKTPQEAERVLELPVFAAVPIARSHLLIEKKSLPIVDSAYQMLSTNLWFGNAEMTGNTLLFASAEPDCGRSVTAANLAVTLAKDGARVIIVDSDMRQPSQHILFKVDNTAGLSNVLAGQLPLKDALKPTTQTDLLVLPSGPLPSNPVRLLRSPEMQKFVSEIKELADYVVFDSPAGITFADATLLAALVKNVVVVYAAGSIPRGADSEFRSRLEQVDACILGAVLNMVSPEDSHGFHHFKAGYEELLQDDKGSLAAAGRLLNTIPDDETEKTKKDS